MSDTTQDGATGSSGGGVNAPSIETLSAKIDGKPDVLTLIGTMAAIVAIPVAIALVVVPREFDGVYERLEKIEPKVEAAASSSQKADEGIQKVYDQIDGLIFEMARSTAEANTETTYIALGKSLPRKLYHDLQRAGHLSNFRYSKFNGQVRYFMSNQKFNEIPRLQRLEIKEVLGAGTSQFFLE